MSISMLVEKLRPNSGEAVMDAQLGGMAANLEAVGTQTPLAPFREEILRHARLYFENVYISDPDLLLTSTQPSVDVLDRFVKTSRVQRTIENHPQAVEALGMLQDLAVHGKQPVPEVAGNTEDFAVPNVCGELFMQARRQLIVEKAVDAVQDSTQSVRRQHYEAVQRVVDELSQPVTSKLGEQRRQLERDEYCGILIRQTVEAAANFGVESPEFKRFGKYYQTMAGDYDTNVAHRGVAAGLHAMQGIVHKKPKIPGRQLDKAIGEYRAALEAEKVEGTDRLLYNHFRRLVVKSYESTDRQATKTTSTEVRAKLEDQATMLKDFSETLGWHIEVVPELPVVKQPVQSIRRRLGRAATTPQPEMLGQGIMLPPDSENRFAGTIQVVGKRAAVASALATTVGMTVAAPAVAAGTWSPPGQEDKTYIAVPAQQQTAPVQEIGNFVNPDAADAPTNPMLPDSATPGEQPSEPTTTEPTQQTETTAPTPSQQDQAAATTEQSTPATTTPTEPPVSLDPETLAQRSNVGHTFIAASGDTNPVIKPPSQQLREGIADSQSFDRATAYDLLRQRMGYDLTQAETSGYGVPSAADQAAMAQLLADLDTSYNNQRDQMAEGARMKYQTSSLLAELAMNNPDFLARDDPSFLYEDGDIADIVRRFTEGQFSPDLQSQLTDGRYAVVMNLLTTAQLQLLSPQQQAKILKDFGPSTAQDTTPPQHTEQHHGNHHNSSTHPHHSQHHEHAHAGHNHESQRAMEISRVERGILTIEGIHASHAMLHGVSSHRWAQLFVETAARYPNHIVNANLLAAQVGAESNFNPAATSRDANGNPIALGPSQFLPSTWGEWGRGGNIRNPHDAIDAQARFMDALYRNNVLPKYGHLSMDMQRRLTLAAYNAGPGNLDQYGTAVLDWEQPKGYVARIESYVRIIEHAHADSRAQGHQNGHGHGHNHGGKPGHSHRPGQTRSAEHAAMKRHQIVKEVLMQIHNMRGVNDNGNTNPAIYKYTHGRDESWCSDAASYVLQHTVAPNMPTEPAVSGLYNRMVSPKNHNFYVYNMADVRSGKVQVKEGDVIFYNWAHNYSALEHYGSQNHVGIVVAVHGNQIVSGDGNWNDGYSYHVTNMNDPAVMAISEYIG